MTSESRVLKKRRGKEQQNKTRGPQGGILQLRLPSQEVFIYLFSEGKKSSGELALS